MLFRWSQAISSELLGFHIRCILGSLFLRAVAASLLVGLSLYAWRLAYFWTDWAALILCPIFVVICAGTHPLMLAPWRARLQVVLRPDSALGRILTGQLRAYFLTAVFSIAATTLLAWQALTVDVYQALVMLTAFFLSCCLFGAGQAFLAKHLYQPFARSAATHMITWVIAIPFTFIIAYSTWVSPTLSSELLEASFQQAIELGLTSMPDRTGPVTAFFSIFSVFEAIKIWVVIQFKDYRVVAMIFSLDAALISFVICRSAIVIEQFIEDKHLLGERN